MARDLSSAAAALGRRGGKAGTGAAKRRTPEQYAATQAKALHSRRVEAARKMLRDVPLRREGDPIDRDPGLWATLAIANKWGPDVVRDALALEG
jgi:hypothetical protein